MPGLIEKATPAPFGFLCRTLVLLGISLVFSAPGWAERTAPALKPPDEGIEATPISQQNYPAH